MDHSALRDARQRQPFIPFRVVSKDRSYVIRSPEWILVTDMTTVIGIPCESGGDDLIKLLDNSRIDDLIPLPDIPAVTYT
jgi:hypothetical protein